jgi:hypothetical protein
MYNPELEEIAEIKLLQGAIQTYKAYIHCEIDANNGIFPPAQAAAHFSFIEQMQSELFFIASLVYPSTEAYEPPKGLNCTLDDVKIPMSYLDDDDINVAFETSTLPCFSSSFGNSGSSRQYRGRTSISSVYYSAPQSLNGDDDGDRMADFKGQHASEISVEPSPGKVQFDVDGSAQYSNAELENALEITSKENVSPVENDSNSISYDEPPTTYRECNINLEITEDHDSDMSVSCVLPQQIKDLGIEIDDKEAQDANNDEYVKTPPASPFHANNSIDAITEALQGIKINRSAMLDTIEDDEIISGYNEMIAKTLEPKETVNQNYLKFVTTRRPLSASLERLPLKDVQLGNSRRSVCL